ncbi:hypothetical protein TNCV_1382301 [Trichonephila clavipes]|nr:hypothetical protein TNCV_1382301 [Trichonephila clavipes]
MIDGSTLSPFFKFLKALISTFPSSLISRLSPSVHYKSRAVVPSPSFFSETMEQEFSLSQLASCHHINQEARRRPRILYITFMMNFRGVLIRLKPSEVTELKLYYAVNIIDLMMEILPYH